MAGECGTINVEFDGTEPLAFIDGENLQYVVVGTFDSDGVTEAIAYYDLGYEDLASPNDLDSYAIYYPITAPVPFSQNDPAWDAYTAYSDDERRRCASCRQIYLGSHACTTKAPG